MGQAKQQMLEAEDSGYYSSDEELFFCGNCFSDDGMIKFIQKYGEPGVCGFCGVDEASEIVLHVNECVHHIVSSLSTAYDIPENTLSYESREGGWQGRTYDTFDLVYGLSDNENVSDYVLSSIVVQVWSDANPFALSDGLALQSAWKEFSSVLKHNSRYFFYESFDRVPRELNYDEADPRVALDYMGSIIEEFGLLSELPVSTDLFRVRIVDPGVVLETGAEIGPPPASLAQMANRASPAGISMFYGAFDIDTAVAETYEPENDDGTKQLYCGRFRPIRPLKVLDFSKLPAIPSIFDEDERENIPSADFLCEFLADFVAPIDRKRTPHVDYVPTQVVTEYIRYKWQSEAGVVVDGIVYPSSKVLDDSKAIVIFADNEECLDPNVPQQYYIAPNHILEFCDIQILKK